VERRTKSVTEAVKHALEPVVYWANNPLSIAGVVIVTASAFSMVYSWLVFGPGHLSPYAGIVMWLLLPAIFVLGLVLIPTGMYRRRHRAYTSGTVPVLFPPLDFNSPLYRRPFAVIVGLTILNVAILITATYRGVNYMDSVQFCGQTCHRVMDPEYTAYQNSPHSRVECVSCHIGPGASWFVRSKLSGTYQVYAVAFNKYPRPIPTPVMNLRPARETCEQCHWPARFAGDRMTVHTHFGDDEKNAQTQTVLLMRIGGEDPITHQPAGIHGVHMAPGTTIEYRASDERRQEIPEVVLHRGETDQTFKQEGVTLTEQQRQIPMRVMDCVDCHNRPTHTFQLAEAAVDQMMAAGAISPALPFAKKKSVELLKTKYASREEAGQKIEAAFREYYRSSYPQVFSEKQKELDNAVRALNAIYMRNVFPAMNIDWGTYPNNIGHMAYPGCFRCHDGNHKGDKGDTISMDCSACHNLLATDEPSPKILEQLGMTRR